MWRNWSPHTRLAGTQNGTTAVGDGPAGPPTFKHCTQPLHLGTNSRGTKTFALTKRAHMDASGTGSVTAPRGDSPEAHRPPRTTGRGLRATGHRSAQRGWSPAACGSAAEPRNAMLRARPDTRAAWQRAAGMERAERRLRRGRGRWVSAEVW